jgi:hypothetical protein
VSQKIAKVRQPKFRSSKAGILLLTVLAVGFSLGNCGNQIDEVKTRL